MSRLRHYGAVALTHALRALQPLESLTLRGIPLDTRIAPPPIFIIGAPRSGSTVLSQLLANTLDVAYPSNLVKLFTYAPVIGVRAHQRLLGGRAFNRFESEHGRTEGLDEPSEMGRFWYRWFPRDHHFIAAGEIPAQRLAGLRRTLIAIARATDRPFLIKNLNCGQRIQVLSELLPEALWLFCRRDPVSTAYSILQGRRDVNGNETDWWSVQPRDYDALRNLPPVDQVVGQVLSIERQIEGDLRALPNDQTLEVSYESVCASPADTVRIFVEWCARNGVQLRERAGASMPVLKVSTPSEQDPRVQTLRAALTSAQQRMSR